MKTNGITVFAIRSLAFVGCLIHLFWAAATAAAASTVDVDARTLRPDETAGDIFVVVYRYDDLDSVVSVDYGTADGTATAGADYKAVSGTLTFAAGETSQTVRITIMNDASQESPTESFTLNLSNPSAGAILDTTPSATILIRDNDPGIGLSPVSELVAEWEGEVRLTVSRGHDFDLPPFSVDIATSDETAIAGVDYTSLAATLRFAQGESAKVVSVPIINNSLREPNKTFRLTLSNPTAGLELGTNDTAIVTIVDDDPGFAFVTDQRRVYEHVGMLKLQVDRGHTPAEQAASVDYVFTDATATAGEDYAALAGRLEFAAGQRFGFIEVPILQDRAVEANETFRVTLVNPSAGFAAGAPSRQVCRVTILDVSDLEPRAFGGLEVAAGGQMQWALTAKMPTRLAQQYSIFQLESSTDLANWQPLPLLGYLDGLTNPPRYQVELDRSVSSRFFRQQSTFQYSPYAPPSGPLAVGKTRRLLTDPTRRHRYQIPGPDRFMASIWYPAAPRPGTALAPYEEEIVLNDGLSRYEGWSDRLRLVRNYAFMDAPGLTNQTRYPVLLYSHGGQLDNRNSCGELADHLCSHGYVVVSIDHHDAQAFAWLDGTAFKRPGDFYYRDYEDRIQDFFFLMDELHKWNRDDPILAGIMDLDRVAASGWSAGGAPAAEYCRRDSRCQAAIGFDPVGVVPGLQDPGLQKPSLVFQSSELLNRMYYEKAQKDAYWLEISSSLHSEVMQLGWIENRPLAATREVSRTIDAYTLSFLNKYLKGVDDHLLDGPSPAAFPRVKTFLRK